MEKIKQDFERAIEYFDLKQKFAINKEYHNLNVNTLVKVYNFLDLDYKYRINSILNALIFHLYFSNLTRYDNQDVAMKQTANFLANPKIQLSFYYDFLKNEILNKKIEESLKINTINPEYIFDTSGAKEVMNEILQIAKKAI